ncbi:MAG: anthranilate phosphoribosyltransferase, partial [Planctomycetota bacterium]|nr:anthranilate phosphoribosyltransferase [Planctomycetota bacterium]
DVYKRQNRILIFKDGSVSEFTIAPEDLGFTRGEKESFKGGTPKENAEITSRILGGEKSSRSDTVLFNAALALYAAGKVDNLSEGVALARESILSGSAKRVLISLLELSQSLSRGGV